MLCMSGSMTLKTRGGGCIFGVAILGSQNRGGDTPLWVSGWEHIPILGQVGSGDILWIRLLYMYVDIVFFLWIRE